MRLFGIIACLVLCFSHINAEEKPFVLATASMIADMALELGGDHIEVGTIVPIGGDPHLYEAVPSDMRKIQRASLILKNGLTFEGWLESLIQNASPQAPVIRVTEGIASLGSQQYVNAADPHAWMTAKNAQIYIDNIYKGLLEILPEKKAEITTNYENYRKELDDLDQYIRSEITKIPEDQRILVTSHDAFQYYGKTYGLELVALQGTSTDAEIQTKDIQRVIDKITAFKIPSIFVESTINPKTLNQIAKDNNVKIGGELYADSLSPKDGPAGTYIKMMRHNTDTIVKGLTAQANKSQNQEGQSLWWFLIPAVLLMTLVYFLFVKK